jgi:hypothetical protein
MSAFEKAFGLPAGHSLRLVRTALRGDVWEWEHEEYDARGALVAVYESWSRGAASPAGGEGNGGGFVKYSPNGWVLRRSDAGRRRTRACGEKVASPTTQPPSSQRIG